jgi:hypothetical protein
VRPKIQTLGEPIARERRDAGQVKLSTFIPLKIRKRGASKVVIRPDGPMSLLWFQRNPLPTEWTAQREVIAAFDA